METLALVLVCVATAAGCDGTESHRGGGASDVPGTESVGGAGGDAGADGDAGGSATATSSSTAVGGGGGAGGAGGSAVVFEHCAGYAFLGSCQIPQMAQCREYYGNGRAGVEYLALVEPPCQALDGATWSSTEPCTLVGDIGACDVPSPRVQWCFAQVDYPPEDPGALEPICLRKGGTFYPPEPP